jgi:hypothetical protein
MIYIYICRQNEFKPAAATVLDAPKRPCYIKFRKSLFSRPLIPFDDAAAAAAAAAMLFIQQLVGREDEEGKLEFILRTPTFCCLVLDSPDRNVKTQNKQL